MGYVFLFFSCRLAVEVPFRSKDSTAYTLIYIKAHHVRLQNRIYVIVPFILMLFFQVNDHLCAVVF